MAGHGQRHAGGQLLDLGAVLLLGVNMQPGAIWQLQLDDPAAGSGGGGVGEK